MSDTITRLRLATIKFGLETEMRGMRLTLSAPPCFTIIAKEFGIKAKRSPEGKRAAYLAFCERFSFEPKDPQERLRYHVTGAIERGEKQAIVEQATKSNDK